MAIVEQSWPTLSGVRRFLHSWVALGFVAAVVVIVTGTTVALSVQSTAAENPRRTGGPEPPFTAVFYGDSLTRGSMHHVEARIATQRPSWDIAIRAFSGTAICDWFPQMLDDAELAPDLVVLQFSGNTFTPCMAGITGEGPDWLTKYRSDAERAASFWTRRGAHVIFVGNPRHVEQPVLGGPHPLDLVYEAVAARLARDGVTFSAEPGRALASTDPTDQSRLVFSADLPCLPTELDLPACVDGRIQVRAADGTHFCPVINPEVYPCAVYSSGSKRFGVAIADAALEHALR